MMTPARWLFAAVLTLGAGTVCAQTIPSAVKQANQPETRQDAPVPASGANNNNNVTAAPLPGPTPRPTPGSFTVRMGGRVDTQAGVSSTH